MQTLDTPAIDDSALGNMLLPRWSEYIPPNHTPWKKQIAFCMLPHREALYGGAAGGGKSDALLMAALQYVHVPGYSAIIFRKTLTDLQQNEGLLHRAHEWLDPFPEIRYIPSLHCFEWPNGARLAFGYMGSITSWMGYQGSAYQFIGWDELTQHADIWYREMISRLRRVGCPYHGLRIIDGKYAPLPDDPNCYQCIMKGQLSRVPLRLRATSNPGGPGHIWVKKRFKIHKNKETGMWVSGEPARPFIPASFLDNPALDQMSYAQSLDELDEARKAQLKEGDWDKLSIGRYKHEWFRNYVFTGGYFALLNPETGAREYSFHEDKLRVFCVVDIACSVRTGVAGESFYKTNRGPSWTVLGTFGITPNEKLLVLHVRRFQEESPALFPAMSAMVKKWRPLYVAMDANGPGRPLFQLARERGLPVKEVMPRGSERVHFDKIANSAEMQNHCQSGRVYVPQEDYSIGGEESAPFVDDLLGELTTWTGHPWDTDDQVDVMSNAGHEFTLLSGNQYRDTFVQSHMNEIPSLQKWDASLPFMNDQMYHEGGYPVDLPEMRGLPGF